MRKLIFITLSILVMLCQLCFPVSAQNNENIINVEIDEQSTPYFSFTEYDLDSGKEILTNGYYAELISAIFEDSNYTIVYNDSEHASNTLTFHVSNETEKDDLISREIFTLEYSLFSKSQNEIKLKSIVDITPEIVLGVIKNSYANEYASSHNIQVKTYDNITSLRNGLLNDEVKYVFCDKNLFKYSSEDNDTSDIIFYNNAKVSGRVALKIDSKNKELMNYIDSRLAQMKVTGELEDIYVKHFASHSPDYVINREKAKFIQAIFIMIIITATLVILFIISTIVRSKRNNYDTIIAKGILKHGNRFVILWKDDFSEYKLNQHLIDNFALVGQNIESKLARVFGIDLSNDNEDIKTIISNTLLSDNYVTKSIDTNGDLREIMWTSILIDTKNEVTTYLSIGSDVTEKNKLRRELRKSEQRYSIAMDSADIALMFLDSAGDIKYLSDVGKNILGINFEGKMSIEQFLKIIHPDEADTFKANIDICLKGMSKVSIFEARMLNKNNVYRWYLFKYKLVINKENQKVSIAGVFYDITDDKEKDITIEKLAYEDDLTGIFNRHKFLQNAKTALMHASYKNTRVAIVTLNLDKFHRFNDLYGVEAGDDILKFVATTIKDNPYSCDSTCARLGNDEFALLLKLEDKGNHIQEYIDDISKKIMDYSLDKYDGMKLTISAGGCIYPDSISDISKVFERAVFSMRIAKADSSNVYQEFNNSIENMIIEREVLEKEVQEAIEKKQFELYYQPKIDIFSEKIVGAEALIRWIHPEKGIISPNKFIPVAEEIGMICEIGKWTLLEACQQNKKWQDEGYEKIKVSVNISSVEFYQGDIVKLVRDTLIKTGLEPQWLEIELTESMALGNMEETIYKMNAIKELGVGISMDDFGTGYSSLSYLQDLPIDELKLDKSFIDKITVDLTSSNIICSIINMAKTLGLVVVAEGVEEQQQLEQLKDMNCDIVQGYLFAKPLKKEDIIELM